MENEIAHAVMVILLFYHSIITLTIYHRNNLWAFYRPIIRSAVNRRSVYNGHGRTRAKPTKSPMDKILLLHLPRNYNNNGIYNRCCVLFDFHARFESCFRDEKI